MVEQASHNSYHTGVRTSDFLSTSHSVNTVLLWF